MDSNAGHAAGSDRQEKYESAILDFLNKEMAAVLPEQKQDEQSQELDAIVSDLLKQVLAESDTSPGDQKALPDEMDSLLSEFPTSLEEALPSNNKELGWLDTASAATIDAEQQSSAGIEGEAFKDRQSDLYANLMFRPLPAPKKKTAMMAIAAACLLAVIAGGSYFISRPSKGVSKATAPQKAAPAFFAAPNQAVTTPEQMAPRGVLEKGPAGKPASNPSHAAAEQKPTVSGALTQAPVARQAVKSTKASATPVTPTAAENPAAAAPENEQKPGMDRPPVPQFEAPTQPVVISPAAIEKSAPPAVTITAAPAGAEEKKPAPPAPAAPLSAANSMPGSSSPSPAPAASRAMVSAIPLSQTSAAYPEIALRTHSSGQVVLDLQIDDRGRVIKATPVSGPAMFHNAAVNAALQWRYKPASIGGKNVSSESRVTMNFNLK